MKRLLLFALCAFYQSAFSQVNQDEVVKSGVQKFYRGSVDLEKLRRFKSSQSPGETYGEKLNTLTARAPGIYALPQDRMICIVPDTRGIVAIPNVFPAVGVPFGATIPNAWDGPALLEKTKK